MFFCHDGEFAASYGLVVSIDWCGAASRSEEAAGSVKAPPPCLTLSTKTGHSGPSLT